MKIIRPSLRNALVVAALATCASYATRGADAATTGVSFHAPVGDRVAGPVSPNDAFSRILPSGRIVRPNGASVVVGMNALGVALSPDGRFAIVTNDDERQGKASSALDRLTTGGYSLAVVDTTTMRVASRFSAPKATFFFGIAALRDPADRTKTLVLASGGPTNAVYAFRLDPAGTLVPDPLSPIGIPVASDPAQTNADLAFPATLVLSADGRRAYAIDNLGNDVATIDVAARAISGANVPVGFFPLAAARVPGGLLVANEGLVPYEKLATPTTAPPFALPVGPAEKTSSLSFVPSAADGSLASGAAVAIPLDRPPDGVRAVGGAHPAAIVAMHRKPYAFVAMSNVDRIATVALGAAPHVVGGTELRLYDRGPYGTQPDALALGDDDKRLFVALAGIDAVAVLDVSDPLHPHRLGLIPTGWYPSALALSRDGRSLFVANQKGFAEDAGFRGDDPEVATPAGRVEAVGGDSNAIWSTLERIDLAHVDLRATTPRALSYLRALRPTRPNAVVPQNFGGRESAVIKHVVVLLEENKTYDSMLGDLTDANGRAYGPGDPSLVSFDATVTPNLHALARDYALAGNFYADAEESDAGHQFAAGGIASVFTERTLLVKAGRRPFVNKNEDPEDYPRAGYVFNSLAARGKTYRDYGDLVRTSGYDEGAAPDPRADDPRFAGVADTEAPTTGFGGLYALGVPALAALADHIDPNYPGWNLRIRDVRRAAEFIRDFDPIEKAGAMPAFTYVWLPADHGGAGRDIPPLAEEVADGDRALGRIVAYLTSLPEWSSTAIVVMPDDAQSTRDHVNEHRSYAIVVSPYAKHHYVGMEHLSTVSALKTEEELLGLPALSLGDALASDMGDFFTTVPDPTPFHNVDAPVQTASREGARIAAYLAETDQSAPDADSDRAAALVDLSRRADRLAANRRIFAPATYARLQGRLFARARDVMRDD